MAKPSDIRLDTGFFRNLKTRKLIRRLGSDGVLALVRLWIYAAEYHDDGDVSSLSDDDVCDVCGWDSGGLLGDLKGLGWVTESGHLHDWFDHQPWIVAAPARREQARKAARARYKQGSAAQSNAASSADSKPAAQEEQCPFPFPSSPFPSKKKADAADAAASFLKAWNDNRGLLPEATKMTAPRKKHILAALKEEPNLDAWIAAFRFKAADPFWRQNRYGLDNLLVASKRLGYVEAAREMGESFIGRDGEKYATIDEAAAATDTETGGPDVIYLDITQ